MWPSTAKRLVRAHALLIVAALLFCSRSSRRRRRSDLFLCRRRRRRSARPAHQRRDRPHRHVALVPDATHHLDRAAQPVQGRRPGPPDRRSRLDLRDRPAHQERVLLAGEPGRADPAALQPDLVIRKSTTGRRRSSPARTSSRSGPATTRRSSWRRGRRPTTRTKPCCSPTTRPSSTPSRPSSIGSGTTPTPEPESLIPTAAVFQELGRRLRVRRAAVLRDYRTQYPNPAPMVINTARLEPDYPTAAGHRLGPGPRLQQPARRRRSTTRTDGGRFRDLSPDGRQHHQRAAGEDRRPACRCG